MEIRHPFVHGVQRLGRTPHEIEKRPVRLALPDEAVQNLGHKQRHGRFPDIERKALQHEPRAHLLEAVHLLPRGFQPLELDGEHRLEQRQLRTPAAAAADPLHHVAAAPPGVGQQVDDHRRVAVFERMQHDAAALVGFQITELISFPERFPDRTAVPAAERRVYKSDPTPNPSLGRGLSHRDRNAAINFLWFLLPLKCKYSILSAGTGNRPEAGFRTARFRALRGVRSPAGGHAARGAASPRSSFR